MEMYSIALPLCIHSLSVAIRYPSNLQHAATNWGWLRASGSVLCTPCFHHIRMHQYNTSVHVYWYPSFSPLKSTTEGRGGEAYQCCRAGPCATLFHACHTGEKPVLMVHKDTPSLSGGTDGHLSGIQCWQYFMY